MRFEKEDKAVQTEEPKAIEPPILQLQPSKENDKGVQIGAVDDQYSDSQSTPETPKSRSMPNSPGLMRIPVYQGPPPPPAAYNRRGYNPPGNQNYPRGGGGGPRPPQYAITSDGDSSASPVSDIDNLYSDDDSTQKPRPVNMNDHPGGTKAKNNNSDDDDETEAWNAVCTVGLRVYSKDEGLEVKVFDEGDEGSGADDEGEKKSLDTTAVPKAVTGSTGSGELSLSIRPREVIVVADAQKKDVSPKSEDTAENEQGGATGDISSSTQTNQVSTTA